MDILDNIEYGLTSAVDRLRNAGAQFTENYNAFMSIPAQYRSDTWQATYDKAQAVRNTISTFTGAIDTAYNWVKSSFGLNGLGQLGLIVPAVPWLGVAAVSAAVTAIMLVTGSLIEERNKSAYIAELISKGASPDAVLDKLFPTSTTENIATMIKWVVIGGAAFFIVPKLLENMKKGRK